MRVSPSVSNPALALEEAQSTIYDVLGVEPRSNTHLHSHAHGSCDMAGEAGCECETCSSNKETAHEDGCDCEACSSGMAVEMSGGVAKVVADDEVMSTSGLTLSNPLQSLHWGSKLDLTNKVLNVHFVEAGTPSYLGGIPTETWNSYEVAQAKVALETFSDALDITIQYTDNANDAEFVLHLLSGSASSDLMSGALGMMFPPDESFAGFGFFNREGYGWSSSRGGGLEQGGFGFITLIHEFGHGFGLAHPHDTGGTSSILPGVSNYADAGDYDLNQGVFTTMSYHDGWPEVKGSSSSTGFGWQSTPMTLDLAILQQLYGEGDNNSSDTAYTLPFGASVGTDFQAIWDSAGVDEIVNNSNATSTIDLREAIIAQGTNGASYVSHIGTIFGGFTIPANVKIENVTGGGSADEIYGNALSNVIHAEAGNDNIHHGGGATNSYVGGDGNDHVYFADAYGSYTVSAPAGVLTITDSAGSSSIDPSVEHLVFDGQTYAYATVMSSVGTNNSPEFTSGTSASFAENGTGVAYTAAATDADADTLTYTITGGADQGAFTLDPASGELTFNASPDFETPGSADNDNDYHVDIQVSDGSGGTATQSVTISITDVDEGGGNSAPVFSSGTLASFAENGAGVAYTAAMRYRC